MNINSESINTKPDWNETIAKFSKPNHQKAIWQLLTSFLPYLTLWTLMIYLVKTNVSYGFVLATSLFAALFLVRIFIIFHDCCHGSFTSSSRANSIIGYISGILTFTPYDEWRGSHGKHHLTAGDLDRRGSGDVWTLTIDEYLNESKFKRLIYRIYRNPFFMFVFGPAFVFLLVNRFSHKGGRKNERSSVIYTNIWILAIIVLSSLTIGLREYVIIQLPTILFAGAMGIWLFYVQHQFEGVYWVRHDEWEPLKAALQGSSYYKLPKVLQWFSGNIGLHHIHHIRPIIPNYNLQQCYNEITAFQQVKPLTLRNSFKSLGMNLWDEKQKKLVSFHAMRKMQRQAV